MLSPPANERKPPPIDRRFPLPGECRPLHKMMPHPVQPDQEARRIVLNEIALRGRKEDIIKWVRRLAPGAVPSLKKQRLGRQPERIVLEIQILKIDLDTGKFFMHGAPEEEVRALDMELQITCSPEIGPW